MMPQYNTMMVQTTTTMASHEYIETQNNTMFSINNNFYAPHITATPVVKSHNPISVFTSPIGAVPLPQQQQQQQQQITSLDLSTTNMMMNAMEIDDYFAGNSNMFNMYSPSSTTTNSSSVMMMDNNLSPTSPTPNGIMHPPSLDSFVAPQSGFHQQMMMDRIDPSMFPIPMPSMPHSMPFQVQDDQHLMYPPPTPHVQPYMNNARRTMPRRHTVSTPYATHTLTTPSCKKETTNKPSEPPITKSRKSSLKAKRHRSLGKIDIYTSTTSPSSPPPIPDLLTTKLELWTHEQLLERVMELEKEREVVQGSASSNTVTLDEIGHLNTTTGNKARSASHTDTELEEENDEEEEEEPQVCKWEDCLLELKSLDDLIQHVKTVHIGSGKANYYCNWKDCPRKQKPFTKRHKMHNHLRTHTGERPFVCQEPVFST
ncbi:hypothetical protein EDC96DRAFT_247252 [Choanephora cucurbitarum]|nr:hypothetical protein EDC96DRAFT_247252 [Choanephora cucurbitarum]